MKIDEKFDYIICGGGATGLLLSHSLISDNFFNNKSVLIIEKEPKIENDKTFSFWDNQISILDKIDINHGIEQNLKTLNLLARSILIHTNTKW